MNISQAISKIGQKLENLEAELLLAFVLKKSREFLFTYPEKKINFPQIFKYKYLINKRLKGVPLAYLVSLKEFWGFNFFVNKNVLIPRPETEILVKEALNIINNYLNKKYLTLIDVGAGSGCIIISLIKALKEKNILIKAIAVDIDKKALRVAQKNAKKHGVAKEIEFAKSDLLERLLTKREFGGGVIITANLPYLTPKQIKDSPSIQNEPQKAFLAGSQGLLCYLRLFRQIRENQGKFKSPLFILCEIDSSQTEKIKKLIKEELPLAKIEIKKDLKGLDRLVTVSF